jgi:DNA-directed RNA polymerase specialized sigma24 family protein
MINHPQPVLPPPEAWAEIIPTLTGYAIVRASRYRWAKGDLNLPDGEDPNDVVEHVITKLLTGEHRWDPAKHPRLIDHLESRVDSRLSALYKSRGNRLVVAKSDEADLAQRGGYTDPRDDSAAEQGEGAETFLTNLEEAVAGDTQLRGVADLLMEGKKPREMSPELGVPVREVYALQQKLMRRLKRIYEKAGPNSGS